MSTHIHTHPHPHTQNQFLSFTLSLYVSLFTSLSQFPDAQKHTKRLIKNIRITNAIAKRIFLLLKRAGRVAINGYFLLLN